MQHYPVIEVPIEISAFDLIIDVRSPAEFEEDHIPNAINLPVLNNQERKEIGTLYKQNAFDASLQGAATISENIARFLRSVLAGYSNDTRILVYCWRGNQRSGAFAHILKSIGWNVSLLKGGYKTYRNHIISQIEYFFSLPNLKLRMVAGFTGTGKTHLLHAAERVGHQIIDLENLANHRGSVFGDHPDSPQPSQKQFENLLFQALQKLDPHKPIFIESESNRIGKVFCPAALWKCMKTAEVIELEIPINQRVAIIVRDYDHLQSSPDLMATLLPRLKRLRGTENVERWLQLLEQQKWPELVRELLLKHYDLAYKPAGSPDSPFRTPHKTLSLSDCSAEGYEAAARRL